MWIRILLLGILMLPLSLIGQVNNGIFGGGTDDGFTMVCFIQSANNNIFAGGSEDGFVEVCFIQTASNNIFGGGTDDGYAEVCFAQVASNNIFGGGTDDGFTEVCFAQVASNSIFGGGTDDGFTEVCFAQVASNSIFGGGTDDGFTEACFAQVASNSIFGGGTDDGFAMLCFKQVEGNPIFGGGTNDGFDELCFIQAANNSIFAGGTDDGFSFFQIIPSPIFPVEFLSFDGEYVDGDAWLSWATAVEINNSHFVLERSLDGRLFEKVATVPGGGTTTELQTYDYYDPIDWMAANNERVYYRLQQVDFDGSFQYSNIIELNLENSVNAVTAYPNPADQELFIQFRVAITDPVQIYLYDMSGREVQRYSFDGELPQKRFAVDLSELPEGLYTCRVQVMGRSPFQETINILIHH